MRVLFSILVVLVLLGAAITYAYFEFGTEREVLTSETSDVDMPALPQPITIQLAEGLNRPDIARRIGKQKNWDEATVQEFSAVYAMLAWDAFKGELAQYFSNRFPTSTIAHEIFMTNSLSFVVPPYDFLGTVYEPGEYELTGEESLPQIAAVLTERTRTAMASDPQAYLTAHIDEEAFAAVLDFINNKLDSLPDLVPLPPQDLTIVKEGEIVKLAFSTIYYNQGEGSLELRADPGTFASVGDVERDVRQRIYRKDGTYRERDSGTFLWHQPHLHYHFADFVIYDLDQIQANATSAIDITQEKSTFCIRDVSHTSLTLANTPPDALYKVCGRERQGISVGWADTYFFTYPDQNLNISDLGSGTYRLSFFVNPSDRFDEVTLENNTSSAMFTYDAETKTISLIETEPKNPPTVTHVYEEQTF